MSKEVPDNLRKLEESTRFFQAEGDATGYGASPDSTTGFGPATARSGLSGSFSSGRNAQRFECRNLQKRVYGRSFTNFRVMRRTPQFQAQFVPIITGKPAPITGLLLPTPPRIKGGTATETISGANKWS
ncbi:uncharacterized protein MONOS_15217 [Monocercomonoides exilis]|uniref:uncharacterized protein n=1 Tax=Monocercomonoides exilis TaxID=2049356 RepID=UPI00355A27FD|nr:hypothetical protein MONOS_15217 [Monocercomonoides exilis]|eukprot:MONOS_15217.1-p1 / transcript=MONOS_15217.1 / gene=MONOS_15217 / organism=Monocercomonoides_exilis_PA203 / gene_product=unspecified product / transcript_product=unspecified product / location=Mono_scaffold01172:5167-5553(-) / protein_length=129 / sequence_SO=supercontig / SO=protein_coding / is_pseudo=false